MKTSDILTIKAVLLYIISNSGRDRRDVYSVVKTAFYAQQFHFVKWALPIYNDEIHALQYGPAPSFIYDVLKFVRADNGKLSNLSEEAKIIFSGSIGFSQESYFPIEEVDKDYLSESNIECLDMAIKKIAKMSFNQIMKETHGAEWARAFKAEKKMNDLAIAKEGGATEDAIGYLRSTMELNAVLG